MDSKFDGSQAKKKYSVITPAVRIAFIQRVQSKQSTIKQAAQEFGIKFSTSKAILQTYKREGRVGKKKTRSRRSTFKVDSKKEGKFQQRKSDPVDHPSPQHPLPTNQTQMILPQEQAQQFQIFQLGPQMNPYIPLQQNLYLQQNLLQIPNPQLILRQQALSQQYGKILDSRLLITPIQSSKWLDAKFNDIGTTLKDFN